MSLNSGPSQRILQIYDSLPPEAQHALLEKLVSSIPGEIATNVLPTLTTLQKTYTSAPPLSIKLKSKEVQLLLDDLARDAKLSALQPATSLRSELLAELTDTLTSWLGDIWSNVSEHRVYFQLAHRCLLFVAEVCVKVGDHPGVGGCKCPLTRPSLLLRITRTGGGCVKHFNLRGLYGTPKALLWIWRALFLALIEKKEEGKERIGEMLQDVEDILGWRAVASIIRGGEGYSSRSSEDDDDSEEDEEWEDYEDEYASEYDLDLDDDSEEEEEEPEDITHLPMLKEHISTHLTHLFKLTPSLALYKTISTLSPSTYLLNILDEIAPSTADTLVPALEIWVHEDHFHKISAALQRWYHLLRPRDTEALQGVLFHLLVSPSSAHHKQAIGLINNELITLLRTTAALLKSAFPLLSTSAKKAELKSVLSHPQGTLARAQSAHALASSLMPGESHPGGMFAAMMMGLPPPTDEDELLNFVELDELDMDLVEVRERVRPRIGERWEAWVSLVGIHEKGRAVLREVWGTIEKGEVGGLEILEAPDVCDEVMEMMGERGMKPHLAEAMSVLEKFCKRQRSKKRQQKKAAAAAPPSGGAGGNPYVMHGSAGLDDVD